MISESCKNNGYAQGELYIFTTNIYWRFYCCLFLLYLQCVIAYLIFFYQHRLAYLRVGVEQFVDFRHEIN